MNIGHFYFLRSDYFTEFPSTNLMSNNTTAEGQPHNRPYFIAFSENGFYWAIPISSKVGKFSEIYARKVAKHKRCDTIDFCEILGRKKAMLIQNMTPICEKHILNEYVDANNNPVQLPYKDNKRVVRKAKKVLELQRKGYDLIWGKALEIADELTR